MRRLLSFLFVVAMALALPSAWASAASTVGTNVSTDGTLSVTGLSTLTGGYISAASSTVSADLNVAGDLLASSTLQATGFSWLYGGFQSNASSSVGAALTVTGQVNVSSTLLVLGLGTFYGGFQSNASSSVGSGLNISGSLGVSSTLRVGSDGGNIIRFIADGSNGNISSSGTLQLMDGRSSTIHTPSLFALGVSSTLGFASGTFFIDATGAGNGSVFTSGSIKVGAHVLHRQNNAGDIGAFGTAFRDVYVSSSLTIGGNGSTVSSTAIRAHISQITGAINLAVAVSSTACTTSSVTVNGAELGDTVSVAAGVHDDAFNGAVLSGHVTAANTILLLYCAHGSAYDDLDPASMVYRIDVWKH